MTKIAYLYPLFPLNSPNCSVSPQSFRIGQPTRAKLPVRHKILMDFSMPFIFLIKIPINLSDSTEGHTLCLTSLRLEVVLSN